MNAFWTWSLIKQLLDQRAKEAGSTRLECAKYGQVDDSESFSK